MASYAQPGAKRQKVRERVDVDFFQGIDKVEYNSTAAPSPSDAGSYKFYNGGERLHSRAMDEWLKFSVSLTHFLSRGSHYPGKPIHRAWDDGTTSLDNHKRCLKAFFDFLAKLGLKYWTAFDTDLVPLGEGWEENKTHWDEMVEFVLELSQRSHVKLLWLAPDLHSHVRYNSGAMTNPDATIFAQTATQIKKCLEVAQRLSAETFLLWPCREGYRAVYQADVPREIKLFAKLLKMTADYKERLNYRCHLLIMPYYNCNRRNYYSNHWQCNDEDKVNMYMWDVTSCLYLLKNYNLERHYKVCCKPGHHLFMANVYNMLGGVAFTGDMDRHDTSPLVMTMKCFVDQGTTPPAGINLQLTPRADGDLRDMVTLYVKHIDNTARALRVASYMAAEQVFNKHVQQRYASYHSGFGSRLVSGDVSLEECEDYYKKNQPTSDAVCCKSEHFDVIFQRYVDACDHI